MYPKNVKNLPLTNEITSLVFSNEVTSLAFSQMVNVPETSELLVEDVALPVIEKDIPEAPDFAIRGLYQKVNKGMKHIFKIYSEGPNTLFITGVPKSQHLTPEVVDQFQMDNTIFKSYWEDSQIGYLFQII